MEENGGGKGGNEGGGGEGVLRELKRKNEILKNVGGRVGVERIDEKRILKIEKRLGRLRSGVKEELSKKKGLRNLGEKGEKR